MKFHTRLFFLFFIICSLSLVGCARNQEPVTQTGFYFDTVIQITLYDTQDSSILDGCFALAESYENLFSVTVEKSDIWRINHSNGRTVEVSEDTASLLRTALDYALSLIHI